MGWSVTLGYPSTPVTPQIASMPLPRMMKVRQRFPADEVDDVAGAVRQEIARVGLPERIRPGARVAITVGSRGISSIPILAKTVVDEVRRCGGQPFIVPAMGSHGGGTAEGNVSILRDIGVTEETVGAPILATMEVVELARLPRGLPIYMDKYAHGADAIILLNRIKPKCAWAHIGSGLVKISTIGLGKQRGCNTFHSWTVGTNQLYHTLIEAYGIIREKAPIVLGLAVIDNAYARPAKIVALRPEEIPELEPGLLREAARLVARLPFDPLDVLILDCMGKNISPGGPDPLVVGRPHEDPAGNPVPNQPQIDKICVLDLTPQSHGNAVGMGYVDVATMRFASKVNLYDTYMNSISAAGTSGAHLPMLLPNDREAIQVAMLSAGATDPTKVRLIRAHSTLHLEELSVSEALASRMAGRPDLEPAGELAPLAFDEDGNLV